MIGFFLLSHEPVYMEANSCWHNIHGHIHQLSYSDTKHYTNACGVVNDFMPLNLDKIKNKLIPKLDGEVDVDLSLTN
jgi:calcineurin-like phosphoesterase family protein